MRYRKIDAHANGRENREEIRVLWRGGGGGGGGGGDKDFLARIFTVDISRARIGNTKNEKIVSGCTSQRA